MSKEQEKASVNEEQIDSAIKDVEEPNELKKSSLSESEVFQFLKQNKDRLEKTLAKMDKRDLLSRFTGFMMTTFSVLAGWVDVIKHWLVDKLMKLPAPEIIKQSLHTAAVVTNFKAMIEFVRTKYYAFKQSPYNEKLMRNMDDLVAQATKQGLDFKHHFP
mgnify:FL=1